MFSHLLLEVLTANEFVILLKALTLLLLIFLSYKVTYTSLFSNIEFVYRSITMAVSPSSSEERLCSNKSQTKMPSLDVVATAHYESGPPVSKLKQSLDDADVFETVTEEAWEEKKVKTTKKTKNIERRVQRQLVLEDGEVKEDSGPVITEDATEDTETNEVVSNENQRPQGQIEGANLPGAGWIAVPGSLEVSEKCTKTVKSHEEVEDELETEETQYCGDVTNQEAQDHVLGKSDIRSLVAHRQSQGLELAIPQKRVVHEATRRRGNIDTVDVKETSKIQDGHVTTETEKTVCKEEYDNESAPDSGSSLSDGSAHETKKETSHNLVHTKDEDLLEYYAVPKGGSLAQGVKLGEGMHVVSEDVHEDRQGGDVESLNERYKREGKRPFKKETAQERTDAVTKKPLNYHQEEKTRKTETNRWLEHHFGSESGRSGTSSLDESNEGRHSAGGNRITITMRSRPDTPEDVTDHIAPPPRRSYDPPCSFIKKIPPPPPPKPERVWSSSNSPTSPPPHQPRDIQQSELTAARARLRSTGVMLTGENKENYPSDSPPESPRENHQYINGSTRISTPLKVTPYNKEPVYSSRYRSGRPQEEPIISEVMTRSTANKKIYYRENSPPLVKSSSPSPPASSPYVGRSQSFHISTLPWFSKKKGDHKHSYSSTLKDYKSEEKLDVADKRPFSNTKRKLFEKFSSFAHRDRTPPPPPRQSKRNDVTFQGVAREAATQTSPSPIPPPRTKRKKKPTSSYFFGQEEPDMIPSRSKSSLMNGYEDRHTYENHSTESRNIRNAHDYRTPPKVERRNRTTKTITPIITSTLDSNVNRYRNSDVPRSSWTNTVDPRRPRIHYEDDKPTTLPRKHHSTRSYDNRKKQYFFGENDSSSESYSSKNRSHYRAANHTDSHRDRDEPSYNTLPTTKHVGRSQSFNVQAGKSSSYLNHRDQQPLTSLSSQKSSSIYRSSPYLNLRSPNMIATMTRSPSMNKTGSVDSLDAPSRTRYTEEDQKSRFMEGLLDKAPELFHFIHGEEKNKESKKTVMNSHVSPDSPYKSKVFTFGKREGSPGSDYIPETHPNVERTTSNSTPIDSNRRTAFNLKTSGRSMLYSPAFRERINSDEMSPRNSINGGGESYRREYSSRPLMS